jgi:diguanylate cyclase (GGDEF)-like protein
MDYLPRSVEGASGPQTDGTQGREQLAKAWLMRLIERTPLRDVGELSVKWIAKDAPPLIDDVLAALSEADQVSNENLDGDERERAAKLARLREGPTAPELIPRDLATLQVLLIEALRRDVPEGKEGDFAAAVERLIEYFGSVQGAVTRSLVEERSGGAEHDELTHLPGRAQLDEWLRILIAEQRRYDQPFAIALIDVDGLSKINDAYGREAGDGVLTAVARAIDRNVRDVDQAFRVGEDEFCVLLPHQHSDDVVPMANRVAELIAGSQVAEGPRLAVSVGVASCPADGDEPAALIEAAEQASYAAKAAGEPVSTSPNGAEPA